MMAGVTAPSSERHGDAMFSSDSDVDAGEDAMDLELLLDLVQNPFLSHSSPLAVKGDERQRLDGNRNQEGDVWTRGQLDRRWVLWHEFMKEHAHLDAWLRLAEQAVTSLDSAHVSYSTAKEELKKVERLRCEAGSQLIQLDSLTRRNWTLTRLFQGTMQTRLLASAEGSGQRWDGVNAKLDAITGRLQCVISEWEEFEAEREELALWLADLNARLTEIDHMTGNTCEKLRRLQSFQQSVCENSGRVNALLQRGELLIQRGEAADARHVESRLLELLRRCSHVYNHIARTHTRLLSMRLVFEDDWILSQASDSGCPSETLHEDEDTFDNCSLDISSVSNPPKGFRVKPAVLLSPPLRPPALSCLACPGAHEHLGLEWDPSVDIGRSVSHDDADSSYFSTDTGLCQRDDKKRWSYLSSFDSRSDISADITNQEVEQGLEDWPHPDVSLLTVEPEGDQWTTSNPVRREDGPIGFDGGRVKAWLRVQSSAPSGTRTSCSRAVQTEVEVESCEDGSCVDDQLDVHFIAQRCHDDTHLLPVRSSSRDLMVEPSGELLTHQSEPQAEEELLFCDGAGSRVASCSSAASSSCSTSLLFLLLAAAFALLAALMWLVAEPPCHHGNRMHRSLHLVLSYVNGPPPT